MIVINGMGSKIARQFLAVLGSERLIAWRDAGLTEPPSAERYLFCQDHLDGLRAEEHSPTTAGLTFEVNFRLIAAACDKILRNNSAARICIIGSESGFSGSYDMTYAGAKAALHLYVETKRLGPDQQLVAIAPGIIADAGMTTRRADQDDLSRREAAHPKGRFVTAAEVARLAHFLLYEDRGYITGTVIRMHGGRA